jgi:hypothetical protein
MDIQNLVDRLEQVLNDSSRVPLSAYLMVNEDKIFAIVDHGSWRRLMRKRIVFAALPNKRPVN